MVYLTFLITVVLYTISGLLFFLHLWRGKQKLEQVAEHFLGLAVIAHVAFLTCDYFLTGNTPTSNIYQALAIASLLISLGYLIRMRRHHLPAMGAFITPIVLLFLLGGGLGSGRQPLPAGFRSIILTLHIGTSTIGVVLFTLAFAVSVSYLLQEQLLRSKNISGLFQRLPSLDILDTLGLRFVVIGFPVFTLGIILGHVWSLQKGVGLFIFSAQQGFGLLSWFFFAAILLARVTAGWRGRRAALGTVMGYLCAIATLLGYVLRGIEG